MRLLIVSNMSHYLRGSEIVGWGPTIQEINHLGQIFEEIRHIACLHREPPPPSALPYTSRRISLIPVPPTGGERIKNKVDILLRAPLYVKTIVRELSWADVVHVRCPANISLFAIILLAMVGHPRSRWVKYAGNWEPRRLEAWSYTFQRWWLNHRLHRGVVTINGEWPNQPQHTRTFFNPCVTDQELEQAKASSAQKQLSNPVRLLYVGALVTTKGVGRALRILARLSSENLPATLDLIGDGPERGAFENLARELGISSLVRFHGWLPRTSLAPFYSQSHLMIFPTNSEGWPKVLSEAMAYGVVPVTSNVGSIPQYLKKFGIGRVLEPDDEDAFARAILWYCSHPHEWKTESDDGIKAAEFFSYSNYLNAVRQLLRIECNHNLGLDSESRQMPVVNA